jgi:hypothetical protein
MSEHDISRIRRDIIERTLDDELESAVFHIVLQSLHGGRLVLKTIQSLPRGFGFVFATMLLEKEVDNGGFIQFFHNSSGKVFRLAMDGFRSFGCSDHVALLEKVAAQYARERPALKAEWKKHSLEAISQTYKTSKLPAFDEQWYALPSASAPRIRYIRHNTAENFMPP